MAKSKETEDSYERRLSRGRKPYDANNSFVKKVATKVTELMPQKSWISKWFNTSQDMGSEELGNNLGEKYTEINDETDQAPPLKRPRIRMDVVHPPGTFFIRSSRDEANSLCNYKYNNSVKNTNNCNQDFTFTSKPMDETLEPAVAGPSGSRSLVTSTPAVSLEFRSAADQRTELNSLMSTQNNGATNGVDDNSESSESTSGCSSLIPQTNRQDETSTINYDSTFSMKRKFSDTLLEFNNLVRNHSNQSRRTLFLNNTGRETMSSRRPSFNASVMNTSVDKISTLASPFYSGNTTFGGASAANLFSRGRNLFNATSELQLKVPKRVTVQVQPPSNTNETATMSQTTKRILETLENFSSLVTDAKKIPVKRRSEVYTPISARKRTRDEDSATKVGLRHLSRELVVPTVADMLKIKRRQRLQDTTMVARKIISANSSPPRIKEYQIRNETDKEPEFQGKMKASRRGKTKVNEEETVEAVNLPSIALPISTLPKFDIAVPQKQKSSPINATPESADTFKFASPIRVSNAPTKSMSINSFTFSKPITVEEKLGSGSIESAKTVILEPPVSTPNFTFSTTSSSLKLKSKIDSGFEDSSKPSGNLMDFLTKKSSSEKKPEEAVKLWECPDCYIKNSEKEDKCAACRAKKPTAKDKTAVNEKVVNNEPAKSSFGAEFKLQSSQWECECCMVRNKQADANCVSCSTPRPASKSQATGSSLMNQFKPVEGSWECPTCMIRNPGVTSVCPCCTTPKPGSKTTEETTKSESSKTETKTNEVESATWECPCCMVRNKGSVLVCPCCEAPKPVKGITKKAPSSLESFSKSETFEKNTPKTVEKSDSKLKFNCDMPTSSNMFKFGLDKSDKPETTLATSNILTNLTKPAETTSFSFGLSKPVEVESQKPVSEFKFSSTTSATTDKPATIPTFTFGAPSKKEEEKKVEETVVTATKSEENKPSLPTIASTTSFSFGVPKEKTDKPAESNFSFGTATNKETSSAAGFTFGASKPSFGSTNSTKPAETKPLFGSLASTENTTNTNSSAAFKFEAASKTPAPAETKTRSSVPTFNFGAPQSSVASTFSSTASTTTQSTAPPTFTFSSQSKTAALPSLGSTVSTTSSLPSSTFSFGGTKASETPLAAATDNKPLTFGTTPTAPTVSSPFGATTTTPLFGGSDTTKPAMPFTFEDKKPATLTPIFGGATSPKPNNPSPAPTFGAASTNSTQSFGTGASAFNSGATPNFFSGSNQSETTNAAPASASPSLFNFSAGSSQPASTGFNFQAPNPATPVAQKSLFTFGASATPSNATAQPPQATPSFGNSGFGTTPAATASPAQNTSFSFAPTPKPEVNAAPVFGQTPNSSTPMFNAPQPNQTSAFPTANTGFNFGATAANPPAPSGGFNFNPMGQTPAPSSSTGGFNFNAPSSSAVSFDPNTRPSFNFTGGNAPATFNATAVPQSNNNNFRKIKKAVRRMTPR